MTEPVDLPAIKGRCGEHVETERLYDRLREHGLQYGPAFQGVRSLWRGSGEVVARLDLNPSIEIAEYCVHPALLDASFQSLIATLEPAEEAAFRTVFVPVRVGEVRYFSNPGNSCWCYASLTTRSEAAIEGNILLCDDQGNVLVDIRGLRCSALTTGNRDETRQLQQWTYTFDWEEGPPVAPVINDASWVVFSDDRDTGTSLAEQLSAHGVGGDPGRERRHGREEVGNVLPGSPSTSRRP